MNPMKTCCVSVEVSVGNLGGLNLLNIQMERRVLVGKHHFCEALSLAWHNNNFLIIGYLVPCFVSRGRCVFMVNITSTGFEYWSTYFIS